MNWMISPATRPESADSQVATGEVGRMRNADISAPMPANKLTGMATTSPARSATINPASPKTAAFPAGTYQTQNTPIENINTDFSIGNTLFLHLTLGVTGKLRQGAARLTLTCTTPGALPQRVRVDRPVMSHVLSAPVVNQASVTKTRRMSTGKTSQIVCFMSSTASSARRPFPSDISFSSFDWGGRMSRFSKSD